MRLRDTLADHVAAVLSTLLPGIANTGSGATHAGSVSRVATYDVNQPEISTSGTRTTSWSRDDDGSEADKNWINGEDDSIRRHLEIGSDRYLSGAGAQADDKGHFRSSLYDGFDWAKRSPTSRCRGHVTDGRDDVDKRLVPLVSTADSDTTGTAHPVQRKCTTSRAAQSKLALRAMLTVSSISGQAVSALPSSGRTPSALPVDSSSNRTTHVTDYVSDALRSAFGANSSGSDDAIDDVTGASSASPSDVIRLTNGEDWRAGGHVALDQSESPYEFGQSRALSLLTSRSGDVTGSAELSTSGTSTAFPGYVNVNNISFDGLLDHYLGNFTSPCLDWTANGTCLYGNGTGANATATWSDSDDVIAPPIRLWTLFLLIFPLLTVFGNILVVMSVYKEKSLRTVTNYFIVSLAIADIMVAVLVMPLAVYVEVSNIIVI